MATKKDKRKAALAKHEAYMAELARTNAESLARERQRRASRASSESDK